MSIFSLSHRLPNAATTTVSSQLGKLCYNSTHKHKVQLVNLYEELVRPCLSQKTHFIRDRKDHSVLSVTVSYNDRARMPISDYFSALGYILAHQTRPVTHVHRAKLLSTFASWARVSARALELNPPTVVQLLWAPSTSRFALAASVVPGRSPGLDAVRDVRSETLQEVWPHALPRPTPVQRAHANAGVAYSEALGSAELFGTPWGHCGESVSFASMHKTIQTGTPLCTLALSVKAMTTPLPGVGIEPAEAVRGLHRLQDIVEVLQVAGALRPMCLNCRHLVGSVAARVEDFAVLFSNPNSHLEQ